MQTTLACLDPYGQGRKVGRLNQRVQVAISFRCLASKWVPLFLHTYIHTYRHTDRQTDRQTYIHHTSDTYVYVCIHMLTLHMLRYITLHYITLHYHTYRRTFLGRLVYCAGSWVLSLIRVSLHVETLTSTAPRL